MDKQHKAYLKDFKRNFKPRNYAAVIWELNYTKSKHDSAKLLHEHELAEYFEEMYNHLKIVELVYLPICRN